MTNFVLLKMKLNSRHPIANAIPNIARASKTATRATLNVLMRIKGDPSNGTPSIQRLCESDTEIIQDLYLEMLCDYQIQPQK